MLRQSFGQSSRITRSLSSSLRTQHRIYFSVDSKYSKSTSLSSNLSKSNPVSPGLKPAEGGASGQAPNDHSISEAVRAWSTKGATAARSRIDEFSAVAQDAFSRLGGRLNVITGYHEIEELKRQVAINERKMSDVRQAARNAKIAYEEAVARRSSSQREVNNLLQRRSLWTEVDVSRFPELVRQDHLYEQEEARFKAAAVEADDAVELQFNELLRFILSRYHEEQVWSDKIRSASTYGSLAALGLNLMVFILAIILVEPWKRKKLVQSFEKRVIELNEGNHKVVEKGLDDLQSHMAIQEEALEEIRAKFASITSTQPRDSSETTSNSHTPMGISQVVESAKDRQLLILSLSGMLGAGVIGCILGMNFR